MSARPTREQAERLAATIREPANSHLLGGALLKVAGAVFAAGLVAGFLGALITLAVTR